ncbi:DUF3955 domain-containing protein [Variovorax boronicumulans]|jgi:hypothetical protein|uniref:DUF3955 domain-containing protein n=1 Tax=Variovorax boronicumulans TaxID=436515 RepID=UPI001C586255
MTDKNSGPSRATAPSARRSGTPLRRWLWLLTLGLSIACFAVQVLFGTSEIDPHGFLYEPLFGLIPVSLALLFIAIVLVVLDIAFSRSARRDTAD